MSSMVTKLASLKSLEDFSRHTKNLGLEIPIHERTIGGNSPLLHPIRWGSFTIGNRIAIQPMEGWDGTTTGQPTESTVRRWTRFGESGAKLIWGGEAMAVRPDGRANPNQLMLLRENERTLQQLTTALCQTHLEKYTQVDDLVIGFQLTHSGRFCRPNDKKRWEPRVAYRHPFLDAKFSVNSDRQIWSDAELDDLIEDYANAAKVAQRIGVQFVDIKCCHGYLLHEFLGAKTRMGPYGGSLENRSRLLFAIIRAVQQSAPGLGIGVRLSAFDSVPFTADPSSAVDGKQGRGIPIEHAKHLPYVWGFGMNEDEPVHHDLIEVHWLLDQLELLGVRLINVSGGSPYYTPHILRPAAYPPSDGYQPHEDPLVSVARHIQVASELKRQHPNILMVGSGYSYLQEFLPDVAEANVRDASIDFVGLGRMVLSYPTQLIDAIRGKPSQRKLVCRTFSDCTTAPRNGLPSGCYPLDDYYKSSPEAVELKRIQALMKAGALA